MTAINIVPYEEQYFYYDFLIVYYASVYNTNEVVTCAFSITQVSRSAPDEEGWPPKALKDSVNKWMSYLDELNKLSKEGNYAQRFHIYDACVAGAEDFNWFEDDFYGPWFKNAGDYPCLFTRD